MDDIVVGDTVAICRDASGWLAPALVTKVTPYYYEVIYNNRIKTSGINRTRKLKAGIEDEVSPNNSIPIARADSDDSSVDDKTTPQTADDDAEEEAAHNGNEQEAILTDQLGETVGANIPSRTSSHRIRRSELQRVLDDAQPLLSDNLGPTRSQGNESSNLTNSQLGTEHNDAHYMQSPTDLADQSV